MNSYFKCIGIVLGNFFNLSSLETNKILYNWLVKNGYKVIIEKHISSHLKIKNAITGDLKYIGEKADLAIIIGGDGNMLNAARILSFYKIKVIGVNRGNLGFLTDIDPENVKKEISSILKGKFYFEKRFLLEVKKTNKHFSILNKETAINEIVLHSGKVAHMIEFEVYIDKKFAFSQRSNGLIISTPTGSTAYSLSAGGPILSSLLEAFVLVPMFPHTLSSRPIVISSNSSIFIKINFSNKPEMIEISCDSQVNIPVKKHENIFINRSNNYLNLIHPINYDYYNTLTSKLGWLKKLF